MILSATRDLDIDLKSSFVIGDRDIDVEAGKRAGCRTILLAGEDPPDNTKEPVTIADHVAPDLYQAAKWLLEFSHRERKG